MSLTDQPSSFGLESRSGGSPDRSTRSTTGMRAMSESATGSIVATRPPDETAPRAAEFLTEHTPPAINYKSLPVSGTLRRVLDPLCLLLGAWVVFCDPAAQQYAEAASRVPPEHWSL